MKQFLAIGLIVVFVLSLPLGCQDSRNKGGIRLPEGKLTDFPPEPPVGAGVGHGGGKQKVDDKEKVQPPGENPKVEN